MALVVNTNIASMNAQRSLAANTSDMKQAMERLSTGKKINSAADDAAGFAIAETMTSQVRGLSMAAKNASDGLGLLKVVENATNDVTDMLQRVRELAVQAKSNTNSDSDVQRLQDEAEALFREVTRVSDQTQYNGKAYLGPDAATGAGGTGAINIQVGYKDNEVIKLVTHDIIADKLGTVANEAVAGPEGNRLHTLAGDVTVTTGTNHQVASTPDMGKATASASYTFTYGATTLSTGDFEFVAPTSADELVNALTTGSNAANYEAMDVTIQASGGQIVVEWEGYGVLAGAEAASVGDVAGGLFTTSWGGSNWTHTAIGSVSTSTQTVAESFLDIKSDNALTVISDAIAQVAGYKAAWGASQNRLEYTVSNLMNVV